MKTITITIMTSVGDESFVTYLLTYLHIYLYSLIRIHSLIHSFTKLLEMMTIDGCSGAQLLVSC